MKIAQITPAFPPYKSGIGNVAINFSKHLSKRGHDVTVFTPNYERFSAKDLNKHDVSLSFEVLRLNTVFKYGNAAALFQLAQKLKGFDIVHLHYPFFGTAELVYFLSLVRPLNLVITYHMDFYPDTVFKKLFSLPSVLTKNALFKKSKAVTVSSLDYIQNSEGSTLFQNFSKKFVEIPFGVDQVFVPQEKPKNLIEKYHLQEEEKVILFVGGLDKAHYFKGVERLIKTFAQIKISSKLIIVGDGDLRKDYELLANKLGVQEKVIFAGRVSDEELVLHHALSDFFVLPSINQGEAFGIVLTEAMAMKKPVIASNLPGVRTVVDDTVNGFSVSSTEDSELKLKIEMLLKDDDLRIKLAENGYNKVQKVYNWPSIAERLENIYKSF